MQLSPGPSDTRLTLARRARAATTVTGALRAGLIGAVVAAVAWLIAGMIAGTAFLVLVLATLTAAAYALVRRKVALPLWGGLAVAWALVLLEREVVGGNGGVWVALAAWLGVLVGAQRNGMRRWSLPLLAYPVVPVAIAVLAGQPLLHPWGSSWLWVPAVLVPVLGARTALGSGPAPGEPIPAPRRGQLR